MPRSIPNRNCPSGIGRRRWPTTRDSGECCSSTPELPIPIATRTSRRLSLAGHTDWDPDPDHSGPLQGFKVGGAAYWVQDAPVVRCACGADMTFLCQVTEDFTFRDYLDPDRAESLVCDGIDDGLLLGNQVYILACPARCDPAAVVPVCQN